MALAEAQVVILYFLLLSSDSLNDQKTSGNICNCYCSYNLETPGNKCQETKAKDMGDKMADKSPFTRGIPSVDE